MGQFSVEKPVLPGSVLSGNQQPVIRRREEVQRARPLSEGRRRFVLQALPMRTKYAR